MVKIEEDHCVFQHDSLFDGAATETVKFENLKQWRLTKKEPPILCSDDVLKTKMLGDKFAPIKNDMIKAKLQSIINEAYLDNVPTDQLVFTLNPGTVCSKDKIKKDELHLYPVGHVYPVKEGDKPKGIVLKFMGQEFTLLPYKAAASFDSSKPGALVPYNWVVTSEEEDDVNMVVKWVNTKGVSLPVLQNPKALPKNAVLCRPADKKADAKSSQTQPKAKRAKTG